jgi:hypothetical protein
MLDRDQIEGWNAPLEARYWMGGTGLRVYPADDPSRALLFIDACAVTDLRKLARDALGCDELRLRIDGVDWVIRDPYHMARDILHFAA